MMKFILQKNKIIQEHQLELLLAEEYWNWRSAGTVKVIWDYIEENENPKELCPVGSVEYCVNWFNKFHGKAPKPVNVPKELIPYGGRNFGSALKGPVFIKSKDTVKDPLNGLYNSVEKIPLGNFQISEYKVDSVLSEWRVFIYQKKIMDIKNYLGDPFLMPKRERVEKIINAYSSQPISYTLDIWVDCEGEAWVMEVHDFFACGLYGFSNYNYYPYMLWRWFKDFVK